jgi:hypothetical protein
MNAETSTQSSGAAIPSDGAAAAACDVTDRLPSEDTKKRNVDLLLALFGIVAGAIAFLPSILGSIKPPYVWDGLLLAFWVFGAIALLFLSIAIYLIRHSPVARTPHVAMGLGAWPSALAVIALGAYVAINGISDRIAPPTVSAVTIEPADPKPGDIVKLQADASDQDEDRLSYAWTANNRPIGHGKILYWRAPDKTGRYKLQVVAADDERDAKAELNVELETRNDRMADGTNMVFGALAKLRPAVAQRYPKRVSEFDAAMRDRLVERLLSDDVRALPPSENVAFLVEGAVRRALEVLPEAQFFDIVLGVKRPCCSEWPGTWPLCTRAC